MDSTTPNSWLHQRLAQLRLRWLFSGLGLCVFSAWWLAEAWGDLPQLSQALVASLIPGLALLYRGLRPMDPDLTLGYLLIWLFVAGIVRSLDNPDTLLSVHSITGVVVFLLPGLLILHITGRHTSVDPSYSEAAQPHYDGRYRGPYAGDNTASPSDTHHTSDPLRISYLALLGLPEQATASQIRTAYRRKISHYHPDRNAGRETWAGNQAAMINLAYDYLLRRR